MKQGKKIFYLGVEGGATKSTALLVNEKEKVLGERIGGPLNYENIGKEETKKNLRALTAPLLKKAHGGGIRAVLGLAGLNSRSDQGAYLKIVRSVLPKDSICEVVNDAKIAMESKCPGQKHRILVIAGTGSNIYAESGKKVAKSSGVGFILSDEGSAYGNGLKAMRAAVQSWDKRTKKSVLERLVVKKAGVEKMEDFILQVYDVFRDRSGDMKSYIASFSPVVDIALKKRDWAAIEIRKEAVRELVQGVLAVGDRLGLKHKEFCLGFMGSQWKMPGLQRDFQKQVRKHFPNVWFSKKYESAVWGAIKMAQQLEK